MQADRTTHSPNSATLTIHGVCGARAAVTTSKGGRAFWLDVGGAWPDSHATTLTREQSRALRRALKEAEDLLRED